MCFERVNCVFKVNFLWQDLVFSVRILSSNKEIGKLIGEQGREISAIRETSHAVLHISDMAKGIRERILTVKGTLAQITCAIALICPKFASENPKQTEDPELETKKTEDPSSESQSFICVLLLPNVMTGRVIGKGGEKIKAIKQSSGASINISNDPIENTTERKVTFSGTVESVVAALTTFLSALEENAARIRETHMVYYTPGASSLPNSLLSPFLLPSQLPSAINAAVAAAVAKQNPSKKREVPSTGQEQFLTIQINVPANSIGSIIGHHGANIKDIRRRSNAEITIAEASVGNERSILIKGNLQQNEMALYLIQSTLSAAPVARREKTPSK